MLQQRQGPQCDHVGGGLMAGDEQQLSHHGQLPLAQLTGGDPLDGQPGQQIVGGPGELLGDQAVQIVDERVLGVSDHLGWGAPVEHELAGALEEVVVGVGHAEQVADHPGRHGQGECLHQVDRCGTGQHLVDQLVHHPLDPRTHLLDPPDGEGGGHHPPQPGVLGVVHGHECPRPLPSFPQTGAAVRVAGTPVVRTDPPVGQQGALIGVAGDQPRSATVPQPDLGDRRLRLQRPQGRRRIEWAAGRPGHRILGKVGQHPTRRVRNCLGHRSPPR